MTSGMRRWLVCVVILVAAGPGRAQDVNEAIERAVKDAVRVVGPSVVQIVTQGGTDMVVTTGKGPAFRKALGPTTGVIVSEDGHIISSLFNFLNSPTTILVSIPGRDEPLIARRIANDKSRMLALLKVDAKGLPVPKSVPRKEIVEGQMTIALGRTLDSRKSSPPSVSVGIVSATSRIWGKAIQTDAKISPVNYGGPLVDIRGRVQGILVPASPQGEGVTAGFEWYDSGIGFAIPFEDVLTSLPRLKEGKDLQKGILGVRFKGTDLYSVQPEILQVSADSPAAKSGLKAGDQIVEIDGQPISRLAQIQHALGVRYEGDKIALKYKRGDEVKTIDSLMLVGSLQVVAQPFLGILPMRDDPKLGIEIRHVFADSPAARAKLQVGERIVKFGQPKAMRGFAGVKSGRDEFFDVLSLLSPGAELTLEVSDKAGKTREVTLSLEALPGSVVGAEWKVPEKLPTPSSVAKAREPLETANGKAKQPKAEKDKDAPDAPKKDVAAPAKVDLGLTLRTTADGENKFWTYVPKNYDPNVSHGLLVWLHPPGRTKEGDMEILLEDWEATCVDNQLIVIAPHSGNADGWIASESDVVVSSVREAMKLYTTDPHRIVTHGMGVGGQMALHLAMNHRDLFRGAATVGAVPGSIKDNQATQRVAFYLVGGELDPLIKSIADSRTKLAEKRYSAIHREMPKRGREYLNESIIREIGRWIDTLDKQ